MASMNFGPAWIRSLGSKPSKDGEPVFGRFTRDELLSFQDTITQPPEYIERDPIIFSPTPVPPVNSSPMTDEEKMAFVTSINSTRRGSSNTFARPRDATLGGAPVTDKRPMDAQAGARPTRPASSMNWRDRPASTPTEPSKEGVPLYRPPFRKSSSDLAESESAPSSSRGAERVEPAPPSNRDGWFYKDPNGQIQGPFTSEEMLDWFDAGYFTPTLLVRQSTDTAFTPLGRLIEKLGRIPFGLPSDTPPSERRSMSRSSSMEMLNERAKDGRSLGSVPSSARQSREFDRDAEAKFEIERQRLIREHEQEKLRVEMEFEKLREQEKQERQMERLAMQAQHEREIVALRQEYEAKLQLLEATKAEEIERIRFTQERQLHAERLRLNQDRAQFEEERQKFMNHVHEFEKMKQAWEQSDQSRPAKHQSPSMPAWTGWTAPTVEIPQQRQEKEKEPAIPLNWVNSNSPRPTAQQSLREIQEQERLARARQEQQKALQSQQMLLMAVQQAQQQQQTTKTDVALKPRWGQGNNVEVEPVSLRQIQEMEAKQKQASAPPSPFDSASFPSPKASPAPTTTSFPPLAGAPKGKPAAQQQAKSSKPVTPQKPTAFIKWCEAYLKGSTTDQTPPEATLLLELEDPHDITDFLMDTIGSFDGPLGARLAKEFIARKHEKRATESRTTSSEGGSDSKRKTKKKGQKVDPSILGFSVNSSDLLNRTGELEK